MINKDLEEDLNIKTPLLTSYKMKDKIRKKSIFRISKDDLTLFFSKKRLRRPANEGECRISLNILKDCGYGHGLCNLLSTNLETGIIGDTADIKRRQRVFGKHYIALPTIESFETLLSRQFEDDNNILLIYAASFYFLLSLFSQSETAYMEALTIYTGLLFVAIISALCDYIKQRQYLKLRDQINEQIVKVYRGSQGTCISIPIRELVVGDVIDLAQGDRVPADCILVEEIKMTVDQSLYYPGDEDQKVVAKETSEYFWGKEINGRVDNHKENPDPFLFADSKVMSGEGKAVVCAVGERTMMSRQRKPQDLVVTEQHTFLENRLETIADNISDYAEKAFLICVITHVIFLIGLIVITEDKVLFSAATVLEISRILIVAIVLMIVVIPEGLPLTISISMALSTNDMKNDNILIKNLESVQTCAMLHDICVSKTGTLTKGELKVAKYQLCDNYQSHERCTDHYFNNRLDIADSIRECVRESIAANTDVRIEHDN